MSRRRISLVTLAALLSLSRLLSLLGLLSVLSASAALAQIPPQPPPGLPPNAGPPRDTSPKTGTARIRGRVLAADTGQPLRKAQVRAFAPELRENRMTSTDADGKFELKELPAGRYTLSAGKGSFVQLQYGQLRPFSAGKPIELRDGETIEKVDFALPRRDHHRSGRRRIRRSGCGRFGGPDALSVRPGTPKADARGTLW